MFINFVADGSANQALITNGSGVLSFAAVGASAGQVIQVVSTTSNSGQTIATQSFTEVSSLTTSITPSASANKILITGVIRATSTDNEAITITHFRLRRDSTDICLGTGASGNMVNVTASMVESDQDVVKGNISFNFLDTPSTTSAVSYKIMVATSAGTAGVTINVPVSTSNLFMNGFTASTLTLMEIKG